MKFTDFIEGLNLIPKDTQNISYLEELDQNIQKISISFMKLDDKIKLQSQNQLSEICLAIIETINIFIVKYNQKKPQLIKKKLRSEFLELINEYLKFLKKVKILILELILSEKLTFDSGIVEQQISFQEKFEQLILQNKHQTNWLKSPSFWLILGSIISIMATTYLRLDQTLSISEAIVQPQNAYTLMDDSYYQISSEYKKQFFAQFSRFYFNKNEPSYFSEMFFNQEQDSSEIASIAIKFVIHNNSIINPILISNIEPVVYFQKSQTFSWSDLELKPDIKVDIDQENITFKNLAQPPALNFSYEGTTPSKIVEIAKTFDILNTDVYNSWRYGIKGVSYQYLVPTGNIGIISVKENKLLEPLYLIKSDQSIEKITTIDKLKQLTDISHNETMTIKYQYSSLDQQKYEESTDIKLPKNLVFYVRRQNLREINPQIDAQSFKAKIPSANYSSILEVPKIMMHDVGTTIVPEVVREEVKSPEKIDVIVRNLEIKVNNLEPSQFASKLENIDQMISAEGYVIVNLKILQPKNGLYQVTLNLNGKQIREINVDTLIPDEYHFYYPQSLKWWKK